MHHLKLGREVVQDLQVICPYIRYQIKGELVKCGCNLKHKTSKFNNRDHRICNIFCHIKHKGSIACTCLSTFLVILNLSVNNLMLKTVTGHVRTREDKEIVLSLPLWMLYWYS